MSRDNNGSEQRLSARLMARAGPGIHRRSMPDGGEVVSGPLATQALRALNARAFTMDRTIFVDEDFDPSNPEDAALYAHERHHQMESGGFDDGHGSHDAEEVAARAIERMVLHRSASGESIGDIMSDVRAGNVSTDGETEDSAPKKKPEGSTAQLAYHALVATGRSHESVVRELTEFVVESLTKLQEESSFRSNNSSLF